MFAVLSLLGVILIARPQALFGAAASTDHAPLVGEISRRLAEVNGDEDGVTPAQRLVAVGCDRLVFFSYKFGAET